MAEPIHEENEVAWLTWFNQFDQHVYPTLFEPRGISRDTALLAWTLAGVRDQLVDIQATLEARYG